MSQDTLLGHRELRLAVPMVGRDPDEEHRSATPLELFFDLVFVVAVALAAEQLGEGIAAGEVASTTLSFTLVFFAIYWAWVNFTWFASAYDTDDLTYRLFALATMVGALIFAAGVPRAFEQLDFGVTTVGYGVMRVALVTQWLRVSMTADEARRRTARRFALGLTAVQLGWVAALALSPGWFLVAFLVLAAGELSLPVWGEAASRTSWHPGHIAERYGLFMIIVLGESVLAASRAIQAVLGGSGSVGPLLPVLAGGLLILFSIWWTYFERPGDHLLSSLGGAFVWSYLHVVVFASVAAVGAGLVVAIEAASGHAELGPAATGATVAVPVACYLLSTWALNVRRANAPMLRFGIPVTAALVLVESFAPSPVLVMGLTVAGLVAVKAALRLRRG